MVSKARALEYGYDNETPWITKEKWRVFCMEVLILANNFERLAVDIEKIVEKLPPTLEGAATLFFGVLRGRR